MIAFRKNPRMSISAASVVRHGKLFPKPGIGAQNCPPWVGLLGYPLGTKQALGDASRGDDCVE